MLAKPGMPYVPDREFTVGWLVGWLVGRLVGWLVGCCCCVNINRLHDAQQHAKICSNGQVV